MSLSSFLGSIKGDVQLLITVILTLAVIAVNGWTDAPNAIATAVSTRAMKPKSAVLAAAVMNFLGVFLTSNVNFEVAKTIYSIADFGNSPQFARAALAASMSAVVLWAVFAWCFSIPTSESHALVAGITGASVALYGDFSGISFFEWGKVIFGLLLSVTVGFCAASFSVALFCAFFLRLKKEAPIKSSVYAKFQPLWLRLFFTAHRTGKSLLACFFFVWRFQTAK